MARIGRRQDSLCECGIEDQTVEHVLLRCALAEEARRKTYERVQGEVTKTTMLYTTEECAETVKIWAAFEKERRKVSERNGKEEEEDRELEWGIGELER